LVVKVRRCAADSMIVRPHIHVVAPISTAPRRAPVHVPDLSDPLTGLTSRVGFEVAVAAAVERSRRDGSALVLVYADLNLFNRINASLGHDLGEELLIQVAERLRGALGVGDIAARLDSDKFAMLTTGLPALSRDRIEAIGQSIADALEAPYTLGVAELLVDACIGLSAFPNDADRPDTLVKHAEAAMHDARSAGMGIAVYDERTTDPIERLALAARLRRAVECDELVLHFQPIFRLADRRILGVEALVRWQDPERGLVPPDDFIPVAERTGVIDALGDWVLRALCEQGREWQELGLQPNFGINISPRQLRRAGFAQRFAEQVAAHGLDPSGFVLELTESAWALDASRLLPVLQELRDRGLALAIDDFGAGYSSLWRLRELPVQVIKIDRSFLQDVPEDPQATKIFAAMLRLADACGYDVVAEGVEHPEQLEYLAGEGCRLAQGFHLGRPTTAALLTPLLLAGMTPERGGPAA
jgi:diguanylate cyclase (GGDEF)-like protein